MVCDSYVKYEQAEGFLKQIIVAEEVVDSVEYSKQLLNYTEYQT